MIMDVDVLPLTVLTGVPLLVGFAMGFLSGAEHHRENMRKVRRKKVAVMQPPRQCGKTAELERLARVEREGVCDYTVIQWLGDRT